MESARIIDANFNRAREALRVLEDIARFARNDSKRSEEFKLLRHRLARAIGGGIADPGRLLAHRNALGDVGTRIHAPDEYHRTSIADLAAANGSRVSEALRSIEEAAKLVPDTDLAKVIEAIRYEAYQAEQGLRLSLGTGRGRQHTLCVLISERLCTHHSWQEVAKLALEGGADCVQLREKELDGSELVRRAAWLVSLARPRGAAVFVNDRPDVALLADADGVHVGQSDLSVEQVRRIAGFRLLVGVSTGNLEEARSAANAGADICGVGPMYTTGTKEKSFLAGPECLAAYLADETASAVPHLAIGGITPDNVDSLAAVGCRGVAVSSCVCSAADPGAVAAAIVAAIKAPGCSQSRPC